MPYFAKTTVELSVEARLSGAHVNELAGGKMLSDDFSKDTWGPIPRTHAINPPHSSRDGNKERCDFVCICISLTQFSSKFEVSRNRDLGKLHYSKIVSSIY